MSFFEIISALYISIYVLLVVFFLAFFIPFGYHSIIVRE